MKKLLFFWLVSHSLFAQNALTKFSGKIIEYSPDNTVLAVVGLKGLNLYAPRAGEKIQTISAQAQGIRALAFSSTSQYLAAAGNGVINVWDVKNRKLSYQLKGIPPKLRALAFLNGIHM